MFGSFIDGFRVLPQGTPYYRLHKPRSDFDEVVQMTVEGVGISSISRIKHLAWNTIANWQYLACQVAGEFNDHKLKGAELIELQADEIRTLLSDRVVRIWGAGRLVMPGIKICLLPTLLSTNVLLQFC